MYLTISELATSLFQRSPPRCLRTDSDDGFVRSGSAGSPQGRQVTGKLQPNGVLPVDMQSNVVPFKVRLRTLRDPQMSSESHRHTARLFKCVIVLVVPLHVVEATCGLERGAFARTFAYHCKRTYNDGEVIVADSSSYEGVTILLKAALDGLIPYNQIKPGGSRR